MIDYNRIIDTLYPEAGKLRDILVIHSRKVADKALDIIRKNGIQEVDPKFVEAAAMLHDIGIRRCDAPRIECHGTSPYLCHGIIGGAMLRDNCQLWGMTLAEIEPYARVCERHTGTGLTMRQIEERNLPTVTSSQRHWRSRLSAMPISSTRRHTSSVRRHTRMCCARCLISATMSRGNSLSGTQGLADDSSSMAGTATHHQQRLPPPPTLNEDSPRCQENERRSRGDWHKWIDSPS